MKILIIDDDKKRMERLKLYIDAQKINEIESITLAENIDEAKKYLRNVYFDILILDVVLPKRAFETASSDNGLMLLDQISRSSFLKKPGIVIGITAHIQDIGIYKDEFEKKCYVVIEAATNQDTWKKKITDVINYNLLSRISRTVQQLHTSIITVHGIQTFGDWQTRLKTLIYGKTDDIHFSNYKYGYYSAASFLFPFLRKREVKRLAIHLTAFFQETKSKKVVIFCHSFGTYLVTNALKNIMNETLKVEKLTLVLSGSVLRARDNLDFLKQHPNSSLINECGDRDLPVCGSCAFVLGVGMAGRVGFHGMNDQRLTNRFHNGGHSLYFKGEDFMSENWLPIVLNEDSKIKDIDLRSPSFINDAIFEKTIEIISKIKPLIYMLVVGLPLYLALK